jgi:hypothetical protein
MDDRDAHVTGHDVFRRRISFLNPQRALVPFAGNWFSCPLSRLFVRPARNTVVCYPRSTNFEHRQKRVDARHCVGLQPKLNVADTLSFEGSEISANSSGEPVAGRRAARFARTASGIALVCRSR